MGYHKKTTNNFKTKDKEILIEGDRKEIANDLNKYFKNAPLDALAKMPSKDINLSHIVGNTKSLFLTPVSYEELKDIIKTMKNKKSSGYDDIPMEIIKKALDAIINPLCHIINLSLEYGIFPEQLKNY